MSARKIAMLLLLLVAGGAIEAAWNVRNHLMIGPGGCRHVGVRLEGPSQVFEQADERPVGAAPSVEVKNAFGGVRVTAGAPGIVKVRLRKVVYLDDQEKARAFADRVELRLATAGSVARIGTNREEMSRSDDVGFETHLEIQVPPDSAVRIANEHGRVELAGVASGDVTASFEGVAVERVAGDLKIESRHGDVKVAAVGGTLTLKSQHGGVEVAELKGPAKLDVQHGDLAVRHGASVEIAQQHGAVTAEHVAGRLFVRAGHSEIHATDVRDGVDLETSFAGVKLARVGGPARVKVDHGQVSAEDVAGKLEVETSFDGIRVERVAGPAAISVHHGGVEAKGLFQGARVRASGDDVVLDGFSGPLDLELERGTARVSPRAAIAAPVAITVSRGEARLEVPEGTRADLAVDSRRGEIRSELPGLAAPEAERKRHGRGDRLEGRLGGGGVAVQVHAEGDVSLSTRPAAAIAERAVVPPDLGSSSAVSPSPEAPPAAKTRTPPVEATPAPESARRPTTSPQ